MNLEQQKIFLIRFAYIAVLLALVYLTLKYALPVLLPFLIAFLIASMLNKPIRFLHQRCHMKRSIAAVLVVFSTFGLAGLIFTGLGVRIFSFGRTLFQEMPEIYHTTIEPLIRNMGLRLNFALEALDPTLQSTLGDILSSLLQSLGSLVSAVSMGAIGVISSVASWLPGFFIGLMITIIVTFFVTIDYQKITSFLLRQLPAHGQKTFLEVKNYVYTTLAKVICSYALIMSITFLELLVGLGVMQVSNAVVIALLIAVFDILPVLGVGGILIPWAVISLVNGNIPFSIGLIVLYLFITVIRNILEPKIVGQQVGLHPVATLASMLIGVKLLGALGLFGFPILLSLLKNMNDKGLIHIFR